MPIAKDIHGMKFGRLTAVSVSRNEKGIRVWGCVCDCGNTVVVRIAVLTNGHTTSCGCAQADAAKAANTRHGFSKRIGGRSKEYRSWSAMKTRCGNPEASFYHLYGGRGVTVCDRWMEFENFIEDMGLAPTSGHSIDRIDPNGNYEPTNCKWSTVSEQANNKRSTRFVTIDGQRKSASEWAGILGINRKTVLAKYDASELYGRKP